jgi:acetyl esterase/lipase
MSKINLHPDLKKKVPTLTMSPWNIHLFRFVLKYLPPQGKRPETIETSIIKLDGVEMRIHKPKDKEANALLIWIHGGGLIVGEPAQDDLKCTYFADKLGIVVVAVKYRLAPQHSYPAAIDDCFATWCSIQKNATQLGINPAKVAIGGSSAGGGLAANLALRIRDEGVPIPFKSDMLYSN